MKLATLRRPGAPDQTFAAVVRGDAAFELAGFPDVGAFLAAPAGAREAALQDAGNGSSDSALPLAGVSFAPLVPAPSKVFCIGLNYRNHIAETGNEIPRYPTVFTKFADSLTGARDPIEIPAEDHRIDWEGELAIVIGEPGRRIAEADAPRHIAGYAVSNDVSMRGWQGRTTEWTQGKAWEAATPVGPYLVTPDEFPDGARITTRVNGEVVQEDSTTDLVFPPAALVSYLSTIVTLRPGDLILTGTPAGVALGRKDADGRYPWLKPGDVLETEIEGLGSQRNVFV
ncbi:5-oxopent-3-ene-1,2,5-tricarboxylate decarboxylase [Zafaria cholistanensis]|uniref:5-oxopent-3-ene-1,2,5-tricarboxylate decarboxylase n=1 Tax=Zafaria cholistanensis TaxID=1682741 RepID=A0A5A7NPV9_9MICC|nr:fumarylacetoacetate hydrolase family protein [Zafaria cholistanensis]GER22729.1 5-oxopent-3-ene-1,2,5-tricarboxylate decarboxylase [Zafaria cholistanensis]